MSQLFLQVKKDVITKVTKCCAQRTFEEYGTCKNKSQILIGERDQISVRKT